MMAPLHFTRRKFYVQMAASCLHRSTRSSSSSSSMVSCCQLAVVDYPMNLLSSIHDSTQSVSNWGKSVISVRQFHFESDHESAFSTLAQSTRLRKWEKPSLMLLLLSLYVTIQMLTLKKTSQKVETSFSVYFHTEILVPSAGKAENSNYHLYMYAVINKCRRKQLVQHVYNAERTRTRKEPPEPHRSVSIAYCCSDFCYS